MRKALKEIGGEERHLFTATFERLGKKSGFKGEIVTVLLVNVKDELGNVLTDHLWFNMTKGFQKLHLKKGDVVSFMGRIEPYEKGYFGRREDVYVPYSVDYKISRPTQVKKIQ